MIKQKRLDEICSRFRSKRILIYGDLILDRYIFGKVTRISPEAPVPVVQIEHEESRLGGAGNVYANINKIGARALILGIVGKDIYSRNIFKLLDKQNLILSTENNRSLVKTRIISNRQQIVRIDRESQITVTPDQEQLMIRSIQGIEVDGIIVSDYGKGTVTRNILDRLKREAEELRIPIIVDPKPPHFHLYRNVDGITPNLTEAEAITRNKCLNEDDFEKAVKSIRRKFKADFSVITLGNRGIIASEKGKKTFHIPAFGHEVFDVTGAGDTVVSLLTLALISGATLKEAVWLSNAAASIVIEKIGTSQVTIEELRNRIELSEKKETIQPE